MRAISIIALLLVLALPGGSHALDCARWTAYEKATPLAYPFNVDFVPPRPDVAILKLERGFDDGDRRSCPRFGALTIIANDRPHPDIAGYIFRVRDGSFPDPFPDKPVIPVDLEDGHQGFRFEWGEATEGGRGPAPIDMTVEVRLVSHNGKEGPPLLLHVMHPGG